MATSSWHEANYNYLIATIIQLRSVLAEQAGLAEEESSADGTAPPLSPSALDKLCDLFGLSEFERTVLVLCMAMELDPTFGNFCAALNDNPYRPYPTINLVVSVLSDAQWEAFSPDAPLRRWQLIDLVERETFASSFLRINERILHFLLGSAGLDRRLIDLVTPLRDSKELIASHKEAALRLARLLAQSPEREEKPAMLLCGNETEGKRSIMTWACDWLELHPYIMNASLLPTQVEEQMMLTRLWEREALLSSSLLLLDCTEIDARQIPAITAFIEYLHTPLVVMTTEPLRICGRPAVRFDIGKPGIDEQKQLWQNALGSLAEELNGEVDQVVSHFNIGISGIRSAGAEIVGRSQGGRIDLPQGTLWDVCTMQSRPRLDDLAARIEPRSSWDDLILPDLQKRTLRDLTAHVRQRLKVYEEWGFGRRGRGLSSTALFAGPSGTGKTLAAEVIAAELRLDLYHIDLSQVVSKYIGETEKNLRRIFDAAEEAGAVLLFDEADALFGKRSEVKDSHDRHANIEVSYLLQRMESYRGLAILTTNMKQALDMAFLRRIRFVVDFPFPDVAHRAEIWSRIIPPGAPTEGIDIHRLANLNVSGGSIWNIAVNAAFIAADINEPIRMKHMLQAARTEYLKLEKQLTDAETRGWV